MTKLNAHSLADAGLSILISPNINIHFLLAILLLFLMQLAR